MSIKEVKRLDIIHKGYLVDGFPTTLRIDGVELPQCDPSMMEKIITLMIEAGEPLMVLVELGNGETVQFRPSEFDLTLGDIHIQISPDRMPCKVTIGGYEPYIKRLSIRFAEGELVLVNLDVMPHAIG